MATVLNNGPASPITVPNLGPGNWNFSVRANNGVGTSSSSANSSTVAITSPTGMMPTGGPTGINWSLKFDDEFTGNSLDLNKWTTQYNINNVTTDTNNIKISNSICSLILASSTSGAEICTNNYALPVGGFVEFRAYWPGPGTGPGNQVWNWAAMWTSGPNWPSNGEIDIAEQGGFQVTSTYHNSGGQSSIGAPPGNWSNSWHTYAAYRGSSVYRIYYDGVEVGNYNKVDSGGAQQVIANCGYYHDNNRETNLFGQAGALQLDYVRCWEPA